MNARLQDKVAIVTGAASGMGAATARLFAERAQVVGLDINPSAIHERLRHLLADVTRADDIASAVHQVLKHTDVSMCWSITPVPTCSRATGPERCRLGPLHGAELKSAEHGARRAAVDAGAGRGSIVTSPRYMGTRSFPAASPTRWRNMP
jgi:NAD(P)-dependent dehydrogenase (short-subunit alcohol dehydrogenase family)